MAGQGLKKVATKGRKFLACLINRRNRAAEFVKDEVAGERESQHFLVIKDDGRKVHAQIWQTVPWHLANHAQGLQ